MVAKTYSLEEMPDFKLLKRGAKKKYPWFDLKPGQGFQFGASATLVGSRSQAAAAARQPAPDGVQRAFAVRVSMEDQSIWCVRIDGLPFEEREKFRRRASPDFVASASASAATLTNPPDSIVDVPGNPGTASFEPFEPSGDEEWDRRARGAVETDGL